MIAKNALILIAMVIFLALLGTYLYLLPHAVQSTTSTTVIEYNISAAELHAYTFNYTALKNASNATDYFPPNIFAYTSPSEGPMPPSGISGFVKSYGTIISNTTVINGNNTPVRAFSMVWVFNNSASAMAQYNHLNSINIQQHVQFGLNLSNFTTPKIGNATSGAVLWPERFQPGGIGLKVFIINFAYKNIAVRIGVYEHINSTSPAAAIYLAQKMLLNIQGAT